MLEISEELQQRYSDQAGSATAQWILSALDIISTAEGTYRNSTNKRLHAELALIKMCELKKKCSDQIITDVPLPSSPLRQPPPSPAAPVAPAVAPAQPSTQTVEPSAPLPVQPITQTVAPTPLPTQPSAPSQPTVQPLAQPNPQPVESRARERVRLTPSIETGAMPAIALTKEEQELIANTATIENIPAQPLKEATDKLQSEWPNVVAYWHNLGRPMIANALTSYEVSDDSITIMTANHTLSDEIGNNKQDIERSILELLNIRATIKIIISETKQQYKPVSLEQRLQYLVDKNDKLHQLKEAFDLTI